MKRLVRKLMFAFLCMVVLVSAAPAATASAKSSKPIKKIEVLSKNEQEAEKRLVKTLKNLGDQVDVSSCGVRGASLSKIWNHIFFSYPEIFYTYQLSYDLGGGNMRTIYIRYNNSKAKIKKQKAQLNKAVSAAVKEVNKKWSDEEKALYLANYLCNNVYYEEKKFNRQGAYNPLVEGRGMCDEYSKAYALLARKVGLKTYIVVSRKIDHGWNLVKIGKKFYHVDVTWMDTLANVHNVNDFLKSNKGITNTHKANDVIVYAPNNKVKIGNEYDNLFVNGQNGEWAYAGGYWYTYDKESSSVKRYKFEKGAFTFVDVIDEWATDYRCSTVVSYKGKIYYNLCRWYTDAPDEGIYCYDPATGAKSLVLPYEASKYSKSVQAGKGFYGIEIDKNGNLSAIIMYQKNNSVATKMVKNVLRVN